MGAGSSSATSRRASISEASEEEQQQQEKRLKQMTLQSSKQKNTHYLNISNNKAKSHLLHSAEARQITKEKQRGNNNINGTIPEIETHSGKRANSVNDFVNTSTHSHHNNSTDKEINHSHISANSADHQSSGQRRQLILLHNRSISRTRTGNAFTPQVASKKANGATNSSISRHSHGKLAWGTDEEEMNRVLGGQLRGAEALQALQKINLRKQRVAENGLEEDWSTLTRNADASTLQIFQHLRDADACVTLDSSNNNNNKTSDKKWEHLHECELLLPRVSPDRYETVAMMVYTKEGVFFHSQEKLNEAKEYYSHAIRIAEQRVARQEKDMYMVLRRYVVAMIGLARIWYEHERDTKGFTFVNAHRPTVAKIKSITSNNNNNNNNINSNEDDNKKNEEVLSNSSITSITSIASLESSLSSASGSVFSVNQALLKAVAARPPRRRVGPIYTRVKLQVPRTLPSSALLSNREDEFVLHSKMTRELVASPCELLLLRCLEVVEIGHNSHSELLIPPLIELAQMYEDLSLYSRALLLVRRCVGILCSVYDYDHPWVVQLTLRASRLTKELEAQRRVLMATKIQATWKMYRAMCAYECEVQHPIRRHVHLARKYNIMHTKQELQNNVITTTNGNSGSVVTIKRSSGFESVLPSITSTPFVMSNRGTNTQNLKNNMISTNESNFIVTHNHIPDFLDSYMENIPINTVINGERDTNVTRENEHFQHFNSKHGIHSSNGVNRVLELSTSELSSTLTSNASLHESQSKLLAAAPENANKFANGEEKEAIASATELSGLGLEHNEEIGNYHIDGKSSNNKEEEKNGKLNNLLSEKENNVDESNAENKLNSATEKENSANSSNFDKCNTVNDDNKKLTDNRTFIPPIVYEPLERNEKANTLTTVMPNAKVIGTTQDTSTDTLLHEMAQGPILTICTTTVTRTVTEKVLSSDEEDEEEEDEDDEEEDEDDEEEDEDDTVETTLAKQKSMCN